MLFTELFKSGRDMCNVCGQTPCNCTHITEGAGDIGSKIRAAYQQIYDQGDDAVEFAYYDSPIFAQYWDEYEGDLDSIIAEVDPQELQIILDELVGAAEDQGIAEGRDDDEECHVCRGTGEGQTEHENCYHCRGSGMEPHSHDDDDFDPPEDDYDDYGDDESHYEKSLRSRGLEERMANMAEWLDEAAPAYTGIDPVVRQRMGMPPASQGEIRNYLDKNPTGVTSGSGAPVTSGSGQPVQSGGAVDVARAADAASPDRDVAVAKPAGTAAASAPTPAPTVSAATTPVTSKPVTSTSLPAPAAPAAPAAPKAPAPTFSKGVTDIAAANKIADPNKINVGQTIKLPSGQNYTVAKGDTLSGIASGQYKGPTTSSASATKPYVPSTTPPAAKPLGPTPAATTPTTPTTPAPTAAPKPTTPAPAANIPAAKNIYVPNVSGAGQKGPTVAAATGSDPTNPINKLNYGTGNSAPPPTMFNQLPKGATGAITKENSDIARIKSLAGLK